MRKRILEKIQAWYNADDRPKGECDCTIIGNEGQGCRRRDCLARTLSARTYVKKFKGL